MRYMAEKSEIVVKKLDFRGKKRVFGVEKKARWQPI